MKEETKDILLVMFLLGTIFFGFMYWSADWSYRDTQDELELSKFMEDLYFNKYLNESNNNFELEKQLYSCEYMKGELENFINNFDCECYCDSPTRPSFMKIAEEVATDHEYKKDVYDCTQFSDDLVRQLKAEGWEARKNIGFFNGKLHEWVILDINIEATSGRVIEPRVFEKYYRD